MDKDESKKKESEIVNLSDYRKNRNDKKLREYERVLFNRILGVYSFAEKSGLVHVEVVDISFNGIRFREVHTDQPYEIKERVALRFYFTPSSYLRLIMKIERRAKFKQDGREGIEYGCSLDTETKSFEVIQDLIKFMHKYTEVACQDENPPMIWF